jgi:CspA family cold shock protein
MDDEMKDGVVKWFNEKIGYGFVASQGTEYFVHFKDITSGQGFKTLNEGDKVSFVPSDSPKGPVATQVVVVQ